jgi:hypothetical protein
MSETTSAGAFLIGLAIFLFGLSRVTEGMAARRYVRRHPHGDLERYMRGQILYKRVFIGLFLILGSTIFIYGILGGRLPGG